MKQRPAWWNDPQYRKRKAMLVKKRRDRDAETKTYVIRALTTGLIKIGRSVDVAARLRDLQVGSPDLLELALIVHGNIEAALHRVAEPHHVHGEWFSPNAIDSVCEYAIDTGLQLEVA